jgi:hypothetical protein
MSDSVLNFLKALIEAFQAFLEETRFVRSVVVSQHSKRQGVQHIKQ